MCGAVNENEHSLFYCDRTMAVSMKLSRIRGPTGTPLVDFADLLPRRHVLPAMDRVI
jgi:hypothetical protein